MSEGLRSRYPDKLTVSVDIIWRWSSPRLPLELSVPNSTPLKHDVCPSPFSYQTQFQVITIIRVPLTHSRCSGPNLNRGCSCSEVCLPTCFASANGCVPFDLPKQRQSGHLLALSGLFSPLPDSLLLITAPLSAEIVPSSLFPLPSSPISVMLWLLLSSLVSSCVALVCFNCGDYMGVRSVCSASTSCTGTRCLIGEETPLWLASGHHSTFGNGETVADSV